MRYRLLALLVVLGFVAVAPRSAAAASITYLDLANGDIRVYGSNPAGTAFDTTKASADAFYISSPMVPPGYTPDLTLLRIGQTTTGPADGSGYLFAVESPGGLVLSYVWVHEFISLFTVIDFITDTSGTGLALPKTPVATVVADGTVQFIGSYQNDRGDRIDINVQTASPVPEPATLLLLGTGAVAARRRLKKRT